MDPLLDPLLDGHLLPEEDFWVAGLSQQLQHEGPESSAMLR